MIPSPSYFNLPSHFRKFRSYPGFSQWETACDISAWLGGRKPRSRFVSLLAPPGAGKSALYMTVGQIVAPASANRRYLILTATKGLQDQLDGDFNSMGMRVVKGRANYPCDWFRARCDAPTYLETRCPYDPTADKVAKGESVWCGYRIAMNIAAEAPIVLLNYHVWLSMARWGDADALGYFDFMVCDEAHSILNTLTEFTSLRFSRADLSNASITLPSRDADIHAYIKWAGDSKPILDAYIKTLSTQREKTKYRAISNDLETLLTGSNPSSSLILDPELSRRRRTRNDSGILTMNIRPKWPGERAEKLLFRSIPRVLMCSGTISPSIRKHLAIPRHDFQFIEVTSSFPSRRRPLIYIRTSPSIRVDHSMGGAEKKLLALNGDEIISEWKEFPGIIHSISYYYADLFYSLSRFQSILIRHDKGRVREALEEYIHYAQTSTPRIIISPALFEGYNLPDHLCRWAWLMKVPWLDGRNPITAARKRDDKNYANDLVAARMLQSSFRHLRHEWDWGITFINDAHWAHFQTHGYFPKYYRRAFRTFNHVPTLEELRIDRGERTARRGGHDDSKRIRESFGNRAA